MPDAPLGQRETILMPCVSADCMHYHIVSDASKDIQVMIED